MLIKDSKKFVIKLGSSTVIDAKGKFKKKWVTSLIKDIKKFRGRNELVIVYYVAIALAQNINCPVIGFFGNEDENPSPEDVDDYSKALKEGGVDHKFYRYDNAGPAFQSFNSEDKFRSEASEDAWGKVFDFFQEKL